MRNNFPNILITLETLFRSKLLSLRGVDRFSDIGEYTYIGKGCKITRATIGRYCSIADNVSIGPGEHTTNKISTSTMFYEDDVYNQLTQKDCIIGNDVWIGVDVIIKRGVSIGDGAIIGANSFVNQHIPSFAIAVGSPATVKKFRFSEKKRQIIKEEKWWDYAPRLASKKIKKLEAIIGS